MTKMSLQYKIAKLYEIRKLNSVSILIGNRPIINIYSFLVKDKFLQYHHHHLEYLLLLSNNQNLTNLNLIFKNLILIFNSHNTKVYQVFHLINQLQIVINIKLLLKTDRRGKIGKSFPIRSEWEKRSKVLPTKNCGGLMLYIFGNT